MRHVPLSLALIGGCRLWQDPVRPLLRSISSSSFMASKRFATHCWPIRNRRLFSPSSSWSWPSLTATVEILFYDTTPVYSLCMRFRTKLLAYYRLQYVKLVFLLTVLNSIFWSSCWFYLEQGIVVCLIRIKCLMIIKINKKRTTWISS